MLKTFVAASTANPTRDAGWVFNFGVDTKPSKV
jgi:hypothetical protein